MVTGWAPFAGRQHARPRPGKRWWPAVGRGAGHAFDASPYPAHIAAEVKGFDPGTHLDPKEARRMARCSQLAVVAAREAVTDAGLDWAHEDRERAGVIMGTGIGGVELLVEPIGKLLTTALPAPRRIRRSSRCPTCRPSTLGWTRAAWDPCRRWSPPARPARRRSARLWRSSAGRGRYHAGRRGRGADNAALLRRLLCPDAPSRRATTSRSGPPALRRCTVTGIVIGEGPACWCWRS